MHLATNADTTKCGGSRLGGLSWLSGAHGTTLRGLLCRSVVWTQMDVRRELCFWRPVMVSPWPQPLAVSGLEHKWNLGTICTGATYSRGLLAY